MFGWFKKDKKPKTLEILVYRPKDSLFSIAGEDIIKLVLATSAYPIMVYGINRPTGFFISPSQFNALPIELKHHFEAQQEIVEIISYWK